MYPARPENATMKLLLPTAAILIATCHAAAVLPTDNDPQQFYSATCVYLNLSFPGGSVRVPDGPPTDRACDVLKGSKCREGCVISGKQSVDSATRKEFGTTCTTNMALFQKYSTESGAMKAAKCSK